MYLTAPGKPGLAYLEDRGQVLSHFQCLSLHRVNHILHPGAGEAAGPAMGWERQRGQGPGVRKNPRCPRRASAPSRRHQRGRDATGRTGRGGGAAAPIARAGRTLLTTQAARGGPGLGVSPAAREGGGDEGRVGGRGGRTRTPRLLGSCLLPLASLAPLPASPSLSCRSSAATWASRDTGLSRHVTREKARWGGLRPLLPSLRKRNTERACAMGARSVLS